MADPKFLTPDGAAAAAEVIHLEPRRRAREDACDLAECEIMLEDLLAAGLHEACGVAVVLALPDGRRTIHLAGFYARDRDAASQALLQCGIKLVPEGANEQA